MQNYNHFLRMKFPKLEQLFFGLEEVLVITLFSKIVGAGFCANSSILRQIKVNFNNLDGKLQISLLPVFGYDAIL